MYGITFTYICIGCGENFVSQDHPYLATFFVICIDMMVHNLDTLRIFCHSFHL